MVKNIIFLIIAFQCCVSATEEKPCLHVFLMCDTVSSNIKKASFADLKNMKRATSLIARRLKIKKKTIVLKGKKMTSGPLKKWVSSPLFSSKDIVIFYYSGHGFHEQKVQTPWPSFILGNCSRNRTAFNGEKIYQQLKRRAPRLLIILFDCCNHEMTKNILPFAKRPLVSLHKPLPGLNTLFEQAKGTITISASSPGEYSIALVGGRNIGSLFTSQFLFSLLHECQEPDVTWEKVLKKTATQCSKLTDGSQNAVGLLEL
jgi:hypothetical protein